MKSIGYWSTFVCSRSLSAYIYIHMHMYIDCMTFRRFRPKSVDLDVTTVSLHAHRPASKTQCGKRPKRLFPNRPLIFPFGGGGGEPYKLSGFCVAWIEMASVHLRCAVRAHNSQDFYAYWIQQSDSVRRISDLGDREKFNQ